MRLLPRKRPPEAPAPVFPVAASGGARALVARLRSHLVAFRVRAILSRPGATASAAATGFALGVLVGAVVIAAAVIAVMED